MAQSTIARRPRRRTPDRMADQAHAGLMRKLLGGQIKPGTRLSERALAQQFGVGRAAVRSAIQSLSWLGLIEGRPRSGTYLRELDAREVDEIIECRAALEAMAAHLVCQRITRRELAAMRRLAVEVDRVNAEKRDVERSLRLDHRFHENLIAASGNRRLSFLAVSDSLLRLTFRESFAFPFFMDKRCDPALSHERIVAALAAGDPVKAADIVRRHVCSAKARIAALWEMQYGRTRASG